MTNNNLKLVSGIFKGWSKAYRFAFRNERHDVIAERVETEEQRQILLNIGCSRYQGYLFGEPVPIEEFEALLKQGWLLLMFARLANIRSSQP